MFIIFIDFILIYVFHKYNIDFFIKDNLYE